MQYASTHTNLKKINLKLKPSYQSNDTLSGFMDRYERDKSPSFRLSFLSFYHSIFLSEELFTQVSFGWSSSVREIEVFHG